MIPRGYTSLVSDFIRPQPRPRLTRQQLVSIAIAAGASDNASEIPGGPGGDPNPGATTDVAQVNASNDVVQVNDANDIGQAGA